MIQQVKSLRPDLTEWVSEKHDDSTRTVTFYDEEGTVLREEPYTEEQLAEAESRQVQRTIEEALGVALTELQAIIDDTNSNINTNPANRIKVLAKVQRRMIRLLTRRFDGTS